MKRPNDDEGEAAETDAASEELDPLLIIQEQFDRARAHLTGFKRGLIEFFQVPKRSISVCFPVEMEDGSVRTFHGYRVLHNRALGPGKGGIRYHPEVTERYLEVAPLQDFTSLRNARVAIQGFGQVGLAAAEAFRDAGARIVALSDSQGAIHREEGLDLAAVVAHKREHGTLVGLPETRTLTNEDLLLLDRDILIPAALGNQIRADNAAKIRARLVVEAANAPTTPAADDILRERGVIVVPDILVNAGGVTVSYFEWVQNIENEEWDLEEVNARLRRRLRRGVDAVVECWRDIRGGASLPLEPDSDAPQPAAEAVERTPDLRTAALVVAVRRVARATLQRGIWP